LKEITLASQRTIEKYLSRQSVSMPSAPNDRPVKVVIPSYAESRFLPDTLLSLTRQSARADRVEIVVVVNNAENAAAEVVADNCETLSLLSADSDQRKTIEKAGPALTVIDRSSPGKAFTAKQAGVGAARKTGLDYALASLRPLDYRGVLVSLDADCLVDRDYIGEILKWADERGQARCAVLGYAHPLPEEQPHRNAMALYEIRLRYTETALARIDTPYAFQTIGSTIVCTPEGYAAAGGMNTRRATEDFYFLMSLAKSSPIDRIRRALVMPSPRAFGSVYLGTGHGVERILKESGRLQLERPESYFEIAALFDLVLKNPGADPYSLLARINASFPDLSRFLETKTFSDFLTESRGKTKTDESLRRRFHQWFDGLKLLQAVHYLRDNKYGESTWHEALQSLISSPVPEDPVEALRVMRALSA
jgi:glycosyltransferase involved in cell wall biosynthesis